MVSAAQLGRAPGAYMLVHASTTTYLYPRSKQSCNIWHHAHAVLQQPPLCADGLDLLPCDQDLESIALETVCAVAEADGVQHHSEVELEIQPRVLIIPNAQQGIGRRLADFILLKLSQKRVNQAIVLAQLDSTLQPTPTTSEPG